LRIFLLRAELDKLTRDNDEQAKQAAISKARDIAEVIAQKTAELNRTERLVGEDYRKIISAIAYLFEHINNRYKGDRKLNEEVRIMLEVLDFKEPRLVIKEAEQKGIEKGKLEEQKKAISNMLKRGLSVGEITDILEITVETVETTKKELLL
jgi:DNA-binding NarL/FixJ family response regulator